MAAAGTLATDAQILLAIGQNASAAQILAGNTTIWIMLAESDMEKAFGDNVGLVANIGSITAANKQWLAVVASHRAAFYAIQQDQNIWSLSTTQSKLNVIDDIWQEFLRNLKDNKADIIADLGL
ncbi:hypothetical protein LCGC14_2927440 [marine sediment metagenome]|uniref:Uncharacterized protein n=1 Tax=marine sediment metagenome TaxID=412755 RepID=A0A0F8ZUM3_9ZZZZ